MNYNRKLLPLIRKVYFITNFDDISVKKRSPPTYTNKLCEWLVIVYLLRDSKIIFRGLGPLPLKLGGA